MIYAGVAAYGLINRYGVPASFWGPFLRGVAFVSLAILFVTNITALEREYQTNKISGILCLIIVGLECVAVVGFLEIWSIQTNIQRYVMPRQLTTEQSKTITDYLNRFEPHDYIAIIAKNDPEALRCYAVINGALVAAGWHVTSSELADDETQGLFITVESPAPNPPQPDPRRTKLEPDEMLAKAFEKANVAVNWGGGAYSRPAYKLILRVGHRPTILGNENSD